jgi:hypothetical protein
VTQVPFYHVHQTVGYKVAFQWYRLSAKIHHLPAAAQKTAAEKANEQYGF